MKYIQHRRMKHVCHVAWCVCVHICKQDQYAKSIADNVCKSQFENYRSKGHGYAYTHSLQIETPVW